MTQLVNVRDDRPAVWDNQLYRTRLPLLQHRNRLVVWKWKRDAWYRLFQYRNLDEVIRYLNALERISNRYDWQLVFGDKGITDAIDLLKRVKQCI
jgi:hypothetical protein